VVFNPSRLPFHSTCLSFHTHLPVILRCMADISQVGAAVEVGVPRFIFVSVHDYNIPEFLKEKSGYFSGKKRAEEAVLLQVRIWSDDACGVLCDWLDGACGAL
jgi:TPP-dependent indolepyruvate ferredoxin oxidoreductase alpha subunit